MGLALTSCIVPAAGRRRSRSATTRSRSASASTASRAGDARSSPGRRHGRVARLADRRRPRPEERRHRPRVRQRDGRDTADRAVRRVQQRQQDPRRPGIKIGRSLVGNYITSLEMAGFSVTLLRLDDELTKLGRAGPRLPCGGASSRCAREVEAWPALLPPPRFRVRSVPALTALDQAIGDGDHGINLTAASRRSSRCSTSDRRRRTGLPTPLRRPMSSARPARR